MVSSTATARAALKLVVILLPREHAATETSAASQMGRVVGKTARKWLSQRSEAIGVRRKTS